jgi:hypothetical protein
MITDDQGDLTLFNSALPVTGAYSSISTEASHNLQVTEPPLGTRLPQEVHFLASELLKDITSAK